MKRSSNRILTTHVGSLPRPDELDDALETRDSNEQGYQAQLKESVAKVVRQQVDVGVDVVNDGEFGKSSWTGYVSERLGGYEARPIPPNQPPFLAGGDRTDFAEFYAEATRKGTLWYHADGRLRASNTARPAPTQQVATQPITYVGQAIIQRDIDNFKAALQGVNVEEAFMPVAAPASVEPQRKNDYYASEEEYVYALAEAMKVEYDAIANAGFVLQIDDAFICALWDRMLPNIDLQTYIAYCNLRVEALNHALRDIPEDQIRYHICWGSWHGPHSTDIAMRDLAPLMLKVKAQAYVFEAANVRHEHEYRVWDDIKLPEGKILIPGVVSHATNVLEHPDLVCERIRRFADRVGKENVMAGTDCGLGGRVHPQLAWAKLQVMAEGARLASVSLKFK
jgi:5-methyltetrahydropteroyltriglutamate--homocysteine methyltransferase